MNKDLQDHAEDPTAAIAKRQARRFRIGELADALALACTDAEVAEFTGDFMQLAESFGAVVAGRDDHPAAMPAVPIDAREIFRHMVGILLLAREGLL